MRPGRVKRFVAPQATLSTWIWCKTLQDVSSCGGDARRYGTQTNRIAAIKLEATPRYHLQRFAPRCNGLRHPTSPRFRRILLRCGYLVSDGTRQRIASDPGDRDVVNRSPRVVRAGPPWEYERSREGTPELGLPVGACPAPNVAEC
jgi:hypothetical protein